jgi:hypothetical protein
MTAYPIAALQALNEKLIRKTLNGSVFIAESTVDTIDLSTLFDPTSGDLLPGGLPDEFDDIGFTTDAGVVLARAITESQVTSWQSTQPTRSDRQADTTTLQVQSQETKAINLALYFGVDLDSLVPADNGFLAIPQDLIPKSKYYRVLDIAVDETDLGEIVIGRYLPNAKPTAFGNQAHSKSNDPILYDVTLTGFVDAEVGTSHVPFFGGAGWKALLAEMGFDDLES